MWVIFSEWIFVLRWLRFFSLFFLPSLDAILLFSIFVLSSSTPECLHLCTMYTIYVCEAHFNAHIYDFKLYAPDVFIFHDVRAQIVHTVDHIWGAALSSFHPPIITISQFYAFVVFTLYCCSHWLSIGSKSSLYRELFLPYTQYKYIVQSLYTSHHSHFVHVLVFSFFFLVSFRFLSSGYIFHIHSHYYPTTFVSRSFQQISSVGFLYLLLVHIMSRSLSFAWLLLLLYLHHCFLLGSSTNYDVKWCLKASLVYICMLYV